MNAIANQLRDHPLFRDLPPRALKQLAANAVRIEYAKGGIIVRENDPGEALYVVLSGRCQATVDRPDGTRQVHDVYGPGDTFGERPLLSRDGHAATVRVITDCIVLRIPASDLSPVLDRYREFEKELTRRVYGQVRLLRAGQPAAKLGRVAVLGNLSPRVRGSEIAHNLAAAVRQEAGCSVLTVEMVGEPGGPALSDWRNLPLCTLDELRAAADVRKATSGLWDLRLHARDTAAEADCVAPVLSHLALYARIVIVHADASVPEGVVEQLLVQADLSYMLLGQRDADRRRAEALTRRLTQHPAHEIVHPLPVLCLDEGERATAAESLAARLGMPVHAVIPGLPRAESEAHDFYRRHPGERFSAHIRHLAREIGRCRLGLALSSGGAKSLAHIGVIQVLEEQGIDVDVVAGTSMGGLIGALWAYGIDGRGMETLARAQGGARGLWRLIDPVFPPRRGFIGGMRAPEIVREAIGEAHFYDMQKQLRVVATDLDTLERVVFDSGEVAPVVHASMAMPGIVVPVRLNGRTLVDGGVAEPIPVNVLMEMGVERILAVNTIPNPAELKQCLLLRGEEPAVPPRRGTGRAFSRYLNYFGRGNILDIWSKSMLGAESRVAEIACRQADVVLRPVLCDGRWHDFGRPDKYIAVGRHAAEQQIEDIRRLVK
ncbi:MAG: cyclic nucleotide-binding domain-containing protein [Lentisphaerae bacterium]|nr:cyclic nucleotide-binding domain-containing protein [Lentisphaerota bacterium]